MAPQMGARTAIDRAAVPDRTPDHRATCGRSVTPSCCTYIGRNGSPSPKPIRVTNCVTAAIQVVRSHASNVGRARLIVNAIDPFRIGAPEFRFCFEWQIVRELVQRLDPAFVTGGER